MKRIILLLPIVLLGLSSCGTKIRYSKDSIFYFPNDKYPTYITCLGMPTTQEQISTIDNDINLYSIDNNIIVEYNIDKYYPVKDYDIPISENYVYTITSSCDNTGTDIYNFKLSQKRAKYIEDFLISKGISKDNIKTFAIGKNGKRQSIIKWTIKI